MQPFVGSLARRKRRRTLSPEFQHALALEVLKTERLRIIALIVVATVLAVGLGTIDRLAPAVLDRIWHGRFPVLFLATSYVVFVLFEASILLLITRQIKRGGDVPQLRRYLGALVETSLPSVVIATHMSNMGAAQALAFVGPFLYFIFIILSTLRLDFWLSTFTGFVAASQLFAMAMFYRPVIDADPAPDVWFHGARSLIILICGILAGTVGAQLRRQFAASIQAVTARDRVTNLFGQHVSPQVAERLLLDGASTQSDIRRVAVMFVDFRSFTAASRSRSPQEVVDRLDGAFAVLVEILDRHGGIVNKFLGDGFLALFGAPFDAEDPPHRAVAAARDMLAAMKGINQGSNWPLRIGIGIHFGEVVAGNIGSPRRKEYTVIGDTVNFASRIEALNKEFNSQLLISAAVRDALGDDGADAVPLGEIPIRGYERPMKLWQLG